ncbi:Potassium channel subfamily K member 18, partial [Brachionus plicatilis]
MFIFRKRKSSKKRKSPEKYKYTITRTPNAQQTIDMVTQATRLEGGADEPLDATEKFHYSHGSQNQQVFSSQTSRREVRRKKTRKIEKFKNACKKTTTFLFSRVGLCIVCIGYVAVGGLIFRSIEGSHEDQKMKNKSLVGDLVNTRTDTLVNEIWNMTKFEKVFHEKNYTSKLKTKLVEYQKNLTDAVKDGYKGSLSYNATKWTYPGSILYSVTIVTTIGYGHITCETDTGKIVTIFYAIFGIPMMLLCLANIGSSMANLFRFLYARVCCGYCNYVKRRNIRMKAAATLSSAAAAGQANAAAAAAALSLAALTSNNLLAHASSDEKQGHNEKFDKHADPNEL